MSESEQRMNNTQSENGANTSEQRWDLGTLFPAKGDPRKPPEWLGRALLYIAIAIVMFTFCWRSWGKIEYLVIDIIVSLFIALAVEPMVVPLVKHGWKRSFASLFSLLMLAVILGVLFTLFGNLFVQQVIALVNGLPDLYEQMCQFVSQYANFQLPEINNLGNEILKNIQTSWVTDFAGTALNTVSGLFSFLINLMTVIMTTYYISAAGPKLRRAACQWMAPAAQRRFLFVWTVSQSQISSFLFSRAILALLNAFFTGICLMLLHVPYWLPLALFCGMVSQFIPMLGTYIGGALPVLFAWGSCGLWQAVVVLMFICCACLFGIGSPEQFLIVKHAKGGEMLGGCCIQGAFNLGNAVGAFLGGIPVAMGLGYNFPALIGMPMALAGAICLLVFHKKYE